MRSSTLLIALGLSAAQLAAAHPGEDHAKEALERREFLKNNVPNLNHCSSKLDSLGVSDRAELRRRNLLHGIRERRGLVARRETTEDDALYDAQVTDESLQFRSTASCTLSHETIEGPYYVAGESIRSDITEGQRGVPLHIDITFVNAATCEPVVGAWVDAWHANATGVYGGVVQQGDENKNLSWADSWGTTFLRGLQQTDADGAVHFETIFPGHYEGRAIHIHALSHLHATVLPNNTIIDATASHVGQMYFPPEIIDRVLALAPYSDNHAPLTSNDDDQFLQEDLAAGSNPIMDYSLVGDKIEDGIVAWLSFGINPTNGYDVRPVTTYHPEPTQA